MRPVYLPQTLAAWDSPQRDAILKQELERVDPGLLPLREAMAHGNQVAAEPVRVLVLTTGEAEGETGEGQGKTDVLADKTWQGATETGEEEVGTGDEEDAGGAGAEGGDYRARVGLLFASLIGGCQCADDPSPLEALPEYAEMEIWIDRRTGVARWRLRD